MHTVKRPKRPCPQMTRSIPSAERKKKARKREDSKRSQSVWLGRTSRILRHCLIHLRHACAFTSHTHTHTHAHTHTHTHTKGRGRKHITVFLRCPQHWVRVALTFHILSRLAGPSAVNGCPSLPPAHFLTPNHEVTMNHTKFTFMLLLFSPSQIHPTLLQGLGQVPPCVCAHNSSSLCFTPIPLSTCLSSTELGLLYLRNLCLLYPLQH
jgi:hypothetical protein